MTNTQWYLTADIIQGAGILKQSYTSDSAGWLDYAQKASDLRFRDKLGTYWYMDALLEHWYRFEEQDWRRTHPAPNTLEGLATVSNLLGISHAESIGMEDPFEGQERMPAQAVFQTLIEAHRKAFAQGQTSSEELEQMLGRLLLLDKQGGFWTVGFHSNRWYCFRDGRWLVAEQPPQADQLVIWQGDSALDQISEQVGVQVITFLLYGAGTLPEQVSEPWTPPASFPDLAKPYRTCDLCGTNNPHDSRYCNQCGARFGCPQCGGENPPGSRFCNHCGVALQSAGGA